jgi:hypothetical protein
MFEVLNGTLVFLGLCARIKRSKVFSLACLGTFLR